MRSGLARTTSGRPSGHLSLRSSNLGDTRLPPGAQNLVDEVLTVASIADGPHQDLEFVVVAAHGSAMGAYPSGAPALRTPMRKVWSVKRRKIPSERNWSAVPPESGPIADRCGFFSLGPLRDIQGAEGAGVASLAESSARYFRLVTWRPATSHASSPPRYHETFGYPRATSSIARLRASQKPAFQE